MPTVRKAAAVQPIVYPKTGAFRTSRELSALNNEHSPDRLPEHPELRLDIRTSAGWDEVMDEILKYNAVDEFEAALMLERQALDPAVESGQKEYAAQVLGVKVRVVGLRP